MVVELWEFSITRPRTQGISVERVAARTFEQAWAVLVRDIEREPTMLKAEKLGLVWVERTYL